MPSSPTSRFVREFVFRDISRQKREVDLQAYGMGLHWITLGAINADCTPTYCVIICTGEVLDWLGFGDCYTISARDGDLWAFEKGSE